jgi:hypothetical protein
MLCFATTAIAFNSNLKNARFSHSLNVRSKSVPFLDQPPALKGKLPGEVGFDPLNLTGLWGDKDWSKQVVPQLWPEPIETTPITTLEWMTEAEIKHGRIAMLAVVGWVAVDFGLRFPGESFSAIPGSFEAHTAAVSNGSLGFLLNIVSFLELINGAAIFDQAKGSGRKSGEFNFDPLGLGKNPKNFERYAVSEVKNGRLAMLAFAGIVTQSALFPDKAFPFF